MGPETFLLQVVSEGACRNTGSILGCVGSRLNLKNMLIYLYLGTLLLQFLGNTDCIILMRFDRS